jgi:RNA polymerase sigma factor (sigma-70 family)
MAGVFFMMGGNRAITTGSVGPELLGRLFDRHAAALELYARQWCASPDDVVQEALILLAAEPHEPQDVVAWLYRVVRTRAINASRSSRRRKQHEAAAARAETAWFVRSPGELLDAQVAAKALGELSTDEREVVIAHVWGGLTFQQIGQLMSTSDSTAHRRYLAALASLRQKLRLSCPRNDSTTS